MSAIVSRVISIITTGRAIIIRVEETISGILSDADWIISAIPSVMALNMLKTTSTEQLTPCRQDIRTLRVKAKHIKRAAMLL